MKATELMIGDWVHNSYHRKNIQWNYGEMFCPNGNPVIGKDLNPIPLTPEILKKNGFNEQIKRFHKEGYLFRIELGISYTYSNPRCEITAYVMETYHSTESYRKNPPSGFRFFVSVFEENDRTKEAVKVKKHIYCVHELQHALRLCGLNDLADNFKL